MLFKKTLTIFISKKKNPCNEQTKLVQYLFGQFRAGTSVVNVLEWLNVGFAPPSQVYVPWVK